MIRKIGQSLFFLIVFVILTCKVNVVHSQSLSINNIPQIIGVSSYINNIIIRWEALPKCIKYEIRYAKHSNMIMATLLETQTPMANLINLQKGNEYYCQIRAFYDTSWTEWSEVKRIKTASFSASVTTYNALSSTAKVQPEFAWNLRKDAFKEIVLQNNNNPDIIAFQESTQMATELVAMFNPYYDSHVSARVVSSARVISWKREKFKLVSFNDDYDIFGSEVIGRDGARYVTQVRLKELETGKEIMVFSVHLPASTNLPKVEGQIIRGVGAKNLAKYVKEEERKYGIPIIVVGDFNNYSKTVINEYPSAPMILVENGFKDTFDEALTHTNQNFSTVVNRASSSVKVGVKGSKRIDYIFTYPANRIAVTDYSIIINPQNGSSTLLKKPIPSDHHPVRSVLHFVY